MCHQELGRGVTRFVIWTMQGRGSEELRGERWRVSWSLKIPHSPKDGCQGNRGEDRYWTSHHFYCQLPYRKSFTAADGVKGFGAGVWFVCIEIKTLSRYEPPLCFLFVKARWLEGREWWILTSQTAIIITDPADFGAHLDKWREGFWYLREAMCKSG